MIELDFYKTPAGCYVEYYDQRPTNVLIIHESYEDAKNKPYSDDYILCTIFQPYDIRFGDSPIRYNRKLVIDSWLAIGISDWEDVIQVPEDKVYRFMFRGIFEEC